MKCPKCGYLGFETSDRCRNCGYDFSLNVRSDRAPELPLRSTDVQESSLADLELGQREVTPETHEPTFDLDRVIGASASSSEGSGFARRGPRVAVATPPARENATESASVPAVEIAAPVDAAELPLFGSAPTEIDDTPLITSPRPARPPLSVRRATPDVVRGRSRSSRAPRREEPADFGLQLDPHEIDAAQVPAGDSRPAPPPSVRAAGAIARLIAMLIDVAVLGSIDAAVLYFTLAIAGMTVDQITQLPVIPLAAFLVILDGGYLIGFTAASGQTIGKMATSIRVISDDGRRVDPAGAVLRAGGCVLTLLTAGLGYLPAFFSLEGRAVQDRVAGTRVVSTR